MPAPAAAMASQVRSGKRWPIKNRAISAVKSGPTAMVTNTLPTLVSVSAIMNAVNITLQHTPESQNAVLRQGMARKTPLPCQTGKITKSDSAVKKLRQNVTSKLLANSSWRVTTPAIDHIRVTAIITKTALRCVNFMPDFSNEKSQNYISNFGFCINF